MVNVNATGLTDPGLKRARNEDRIWLDGARRVFVVADGMGGESCGELAASLAVEAVHDYVTQSETAPEASWPFGADPSLSLMQNRVANAVRLANRRIWDAAHTRTECERMGTTISALFIDSDAAATIGNVGDSRVYFLRGGELQLLTRDDAVVSNLVDAGVITMEESRTHPLRNILTLALGHTADVTVQLVNLQLEPGDRLLLCSDGLHGVADDREIRDVMASDDDLQSVAARLIRIALEHGGPDNVSCIVIGYTQNSSAE